MGEMVNIMGMASAILIFMFFFLEGPKGA